MRTILWLSWDGTADGSQADIRRHRNWSIWSVWFVWFIWFNQINKTDQINQIDHTCPGRVDYLRLPIIWLMALPNQDPPLATFPSPLIGRFVFDKSSLAR